MTDRIQLNLRLDGRRDLLETIKEVAAAEGLSVNAWVVKTLEQAASNPTPKSEATCPTPALADIEPLLDIMLDNKLAAKLASFEERLGKIEGLSDGNDESFRQELEQQLETVRVDNQRLHNELGNLQEREERELSQVRSQLETERADRSEIEAELSELRQNSISAATLSEKLTPDAATILSQLRARRKKSKIDLADLEAILEILES